MSNEISNDNLILIAGITGTGKSASLMSLRNDSGVAYANCEASKKLPFKHKFKEEVVTDPMTIFDIFEEAEEEDVMSFSLPTALEDDRDKSANRVLHVKRMKRMKRRR